MKQMIKTLVLIGVLFLTIACNKTNTFDFHAEVMGEVQLNTQFDILVETTNISGNPFKYEGSSTLVGAVIYLRGKTGDTIYPQDIPVTKDYRHMVIEKNQTIERTWTFYGIDEVGYYDLYFEYFGESKKIENFIEVK